MNLLKRRSSPSNNSSGAHYSQQSMETCSNPTSSSPTPSTNSNASTCPNEPPANAHQSPHSAPSSSDINLPQGHHTGSSTPTTNLPPHITNIHPHHADPQSAAAALLLNHYHQHQQLTKNQAASSSSTMPTMSASSFAALGNESHQQLAAAIAISSSSANTSPGLSMGGEHSAFRSLVNTPSAAAFALGLARQYAVAASLSAVDHEKHSRQAPSDDISKPVSVNGSDSEDEEINVHDDSNDADASFYSSASGSEANQQGRAPIQLVKHDR